MFRNWLRYFNNRSDPEVVLITWIISIVTFAMSLIEDIIIFYKFDACKNKSKLCFIFIFGKTILPFYKSIPHKLMSHESASKRAYNTA